MHGPGQSSGHECCFLIQFFICLKVGSLPELTEPFVSFVRLANTIPVPQAPTQPSAKFVFVAFTPTGSMRYDHLEIGRSMAALMANLVGLAAV